MKILFVGSNPSAASANTNPFDPSTKSYRIVAGWISEALSVELTSIRFEFANVANFKTQDNKPLKVSEIRENLPYLQVTIGAFAPDKIVALGKTAAKALTLLQVPFLEMPHPSGRNRQLNDPEYVVQKLKELKEFILSSSNTESNL